MIFLAGKTQFFMYHTALRYSHSGKELNIPDKGPSRLADCYEM